MNGPARSRNKSPLALHLVYRMLEPGPVVLLTTEGPRGPNVMAMSWHMMVDFEPPIVACVVSDRDYTFGLLKRSGECVINIPTVELARQVVGCGNTSGRRIDKFSRFGLTPLPASSVGAPLIEECYASLECRVVDSSMAGKYNMFILRVTKAWIDKSRKNPRTIHHMGRGRFMVSGRTIRLASRKK